MHLRFLVIFFALLSWLQAEPAIIKRAAWSAERSDLGWANGVNIDAERAAGTMRGLAGWLEYDFEVPAPGGWHELWLRDMPPEYERDLWLDGKPVLWLSTAVAADFEPAGGNGWFKETNLHLTPGKHTLKLRRSIYPHGLPSAWELRPVAPNDAAGLARVVIPETVEAAARPAAQNAVRAGQPVTLTLEGGSAASGLAYEFVALDELDASAAPLPLARVEFPALSGSAAPVRREASFSFPRQGAFRVVARDPATKKLFRPADLKAGLFIVIDTRPGSLSETAAELQTRNIIDIDCTATPPAGRFWEKDGPTRVVDSPAGRYRESSGLGPVKSWGADGFSYRFDLPEADRLYRLTVDYPDNDRRTMGFWIDDGTNAKSNSNATGVINTGGIETGDSYPLTGRMLTHQAYFYPRRSKDLVVAVLNLVPDLRAAAARIRIDLVESGLPAAPAGARRGREFGYWFEENGRWVRFFGGENLSVGQQLKTIERYGQWQRHIGSNLMFPTVNVYQGNHYPSRVLDGYFSTPLNEARMVSLVAERYGCRYIPEINLTGQTWFDRRVMGLKLDKQAKDGVAFMTPEAADIVLRDRNGKLSCSWEAFVYNPLHPRVQKMYADILGELADMLSDSPAFKGISSRMMFAWQFQAWNALPGLDWGYDDWTVGEFTRETGVKVPGDADDATRFHQRYDFLTGTAARERWLDWRCARLFAFHEMLRDRIRRLRPDATLYFTYFRQDRAQTRSPDLVGQMREQGIDCPRYREADGIKFIASIGHGRRYSTPLADAEVTDALYSDEVKQIGLDSRTAAFTGRYFELNKNLDWTKLGAPAGGAAFDACLPTSANELELYALSVADNDPELILTGGNGWMFGTPEIVRPFLREFRAIPAERFERLPNAIDPVAVWRRRDADGGSWFYAVNRLPVPVTAIFSIDGSVARIAPAAGGGDIAISGGTFSVELPPFMLRSYRATGGALIGCRVDVPSDYVEKLRPQIESARELRAEIAARRLAPEASVVDAAKALAGLDTAIAAFDEGRYWRAHGELLRLAPVRLAYAAGRFPKNVMERSIPMGVPSFTDAAPRGLQAVLDGAPGRLRDLRDLTADGSGVLWAASADGLSAFDAATGEWRRNLTVFAPHEFEVGTIQNPALPLPQAGAVDAVRPTADTGRLLVKQGTRPPVSLEIATGRTRRLTPEESSSLPAETPVGGGAADRVRKAAKPNIEHSLGGFTQLKPSDGVLYYIAHGKLMRFLPGLDRVEVAHDPGFKTGLQGFEAFAFAPNGDLYLSSHWNGSARGVNLYRCKKSGAGWSAPDYLNERRPLVAGADRSAGDLAFDADGRLLVLAASDAAAGNVALCRWDPRDGKNSLLLDLGKPEAGAGEFGLHFMPNGDLIVAGGSARALWRLSPDGRVIWQTRREKSSPPGYADLRCPLGVTADASGKIWATDPTRHQLLQFDAETGRFLRAAGSFADLPITDASRFSLNQPVGVAVMKDAAGREWLYLADTGTRRLLRFPLN